MTIATSRTLAALAAGAMLLTACSSSDDPEVAAGGGDDAATTTTAAPAPPACDRSFNPVGYWEDAELAGTIGAEHVPMDHGDHDDPGDEAAADEDVHLHEDGSEHDHGEEAAADEDVHLHEDGTEHDHGDDAADDEPATDEPNDMSGGLGELEAASLITRLVELPEDDYQQWLQSLDPDRDVEAPDDTGAGGHLGPQTWSPITDDATCAELADELETAREVAMRYPKASDAIADGYRLVAPYLPGIASHWMKFQYVDGTFEVTEPEMLLYDGNGEDANIVGLSYFVRKQGDEEPLVGFTGDNDHYHRHVGLCVSRDRGVIGDTTTTQEECEAAGGFKNESSSGWMSHAWVVPGCESPWGVFSAQNPVLDDDLGRASGDGDPCSGSASAGNWDLSAAEG